jgi:arylsulfatase
MYCGKYILGTILAASGVMAWPTGTMAESAQRPNIIVILADDMGYSDLGCTGSEIHTPTLDRMAKEGVLFTHCYNASRCCPSRAALLTGQYQWDAGIGHMDTTKSRLTEYQGFLNDETATIGELLGQNGYQTFMAGKGHVGSTKREMWPDHHGFKNFYGTPDGGGLYFYPSKFYDRPVYHNGKKIEPPSSWYSTDGFTDATIDYIRDRKKGQPFFVYLAYIAPHFPLQAKKEDIDKYRDTYKAGYDVIRKARITRQKQSGIFARNATASRPVYSDWDSVKDKDEEALKMAVYAAQIDCLDQNIGKLMAALKDEGLIDNTLVMFMSDNGGCSSQFNKTPEAVIGSRNCNAAYGIWYNISNTPYRMAKTQEHEGGVMTPLIMHWPAGIRQPGRMFSAPVHIMDVMPTCLDLAGAAYPDEYKSRPLDPLDGESLLPLLRAGEEDPDRLICWEHQGNRAVRKGDWKLVALRKTPWELYDLSKDPCEENDLIDTYPEKASELKDLYKDWADEHGVQPWPLKKTRHNET